jgi:peptidyl-prolyl cis-trans isomerase C
MTEPEMNQPLGILRAPLLHFAILGVLLVGLYSLFGNKVETESKEIVVSAQQVELLSSLWEKQWRRPPTPQELEGLVQSFIREEVLYREALAMGLDRDDMVVRRRLAQKIEFLAQDLATQIEPSEQELRTFYDDHPEIFEAPARITFTHVYINVDQHGDESFDVAEEVLVELRAGGDPNSLGDRFMLQRDYLRKSPSEVGRHFGSQFADEVFKIAPGDWLGPVQSGYGLHLVLVESLEAAFLPSLEDVRVDVKNEYLSFKRREVDEFFYNRLREGYNVVIEETS